MITEQKVLRLQTKVLPGGKITIFDPGLRPGEAVEVLVLRPAERADKKSALDILLAAEGERIFKNAAQVDHYLQDQRSSWDS